MHAQPADTTLQAILAGSCDKIRMCLNLINSPNLTYLYIFTRHGGVQWHWQWHWPRNCSRPFTRGTSPWVPAGYAQCWMNSVRGMMLQHAPSSAQTCTNNPWPKALRIQRLDRRSTPHSWYIYLWLMLWRISCLVAPSTRQAAVGKSPPIVVFHGVGACPNGMQLRCAQHRHTSQIGWRSGCTFRGAVIRRIWWRLTHDACWVSTAITSCMITHARPPHEGPHHQQHMEIVQRIGTWSITPPHLILGSFQLSIMTWISIHWYCIPYLCNGESIHWYSISLAIANLVLLVLSDKNGALHHAWSFVRPLSPT